MNAAIPQLPARPIPRKSGVSGFTLIELMVVVAIVAILAAIAFPSYLEQVSKSRRGQVKVDMVELAQRAERFHTVNNTYEEFWGSVPSSDKVSPRTGTAYYDIAWSDQSPTSFVITATPIDGTPQERDRCGVLSINAAGVKTHSKGSTDECW